MLYGLFSDSDMTVLIKEFEEEMNNNIATVDVIFVKLLPTYVAKIAERA